MKTKEINIAEIISNNPAIDATQLEKSIELLRELQRSGVVKRHSYSLETRDSQVEYLWEAVD